MQNNVAMQWILMAPCSTSTLLATIICHGTKITFPGASDSQVESLFFINMHDHYACISLFLSFGDLGVVMEESLERESKSEEI